MPGPGSGARRQARAAQDPAPAPAPSAARQCIQCSDSLSKADFSSKQWRKGDGRSRCKTCVDNDGVGGAAAGRTAARAPLTCVTQPQSNRPPSPSGARAAVPPVAGRKCAKCDFQGNRKDYYPREWKKGGGNSLCRDCAAQPEAAGGATRHLRHRQAERQIVDAELEEAVAHGDKRAFPDDGTIQYTHRNVCFVVSASTGAGITAWRLHPAQCVCRHQPEDLERVRQHEAWQEYDYGVSASSHAEMVLSMGLVRATAKQYADEDGSQHYGNNIYDIADYLCCEFSDSLSLCQALPSCICSSVSVFSDHALAGVAMPSDRPELSETSRSAEQRAIPARCNQLCSWGALLAHLLQSMPWCQAAEGPSDGIAFDVR